MPLPAARSPAAVLLATAMLVAAALAAPKAHAACGTQRDFLVRADPLLASVRPADCATLLGGPPQFTWPRQKDGETYTVALRFPDGHTETRTTRRNWLAWDRAVPAGEYTWRVSMSGTSQARSDARGFRVEHAEAARDSAAQARSAPRPARESASLAAPAAGLFRLEPAETWIPSAREPKAGRKPAVGGFFGGFTE